MPIYEFKCVSDGLFQDWRELGDTTPPACPSCDGVMTRKYSMFQPKMDMEPHFNAAVGRYVTGKTDLNDAFKSLSEERTLATGVEHRYVAVDPREAKTELGVTDEGLDATYAKMRDDGTLEAKTQWL